MHITAASGSCDFSGVLLNSLQVGNQQRQHFSGRGRDPEFCSGGQGCGTGVDFYQECALTCSSQRQRCRWLDCCRGANGEEDITAGGSFPACLEIMFREAFSKPDHIRSEQTAACRTARQSFLQIHLQQIQLRWPAAAVAADPEYISMEFDQLLAASLPVKVVHILGDQQVGFVFSREELLQVSQGIMPGIGTGLSDQLHPPLVPAEHFCWLALKCPR